NSHLHEGEDDDGNFEAQAHADNEHDYEAKVLVGLPLGDFDFHPGGDLDHAGDADGQNKAVAKKDADEKKAAADDEGFSKVWLLVFLERGKNELADDEKDVGNGKAKAAPERHFHGNGE